MADNNARPWEQRGAPAPVIATPTTDASERELLTAILQTLKSIKSTLTFFAVLVILGLIAQACGVLGSPGR